MIEKSIDLGDYLYKFASSGVFEAVPGGLKRHRRLPIMFPSRINPSFVCLAFAYAVSTIRRAFSPADSL